MTEDTEPSVFSAWTDEAEVEDIVSPSLKTLKALSPEETVVEGCKAESRLAGSLLSDWLYDRRMDCMLHSKI